MSTSTRTPRSNRRPQAQRRREATERLVAATLQSLAEDGWAGTSTRSVAQRAGVSQGAQQHYFPTKADLVAAALRFLMTDQSELVLSGHRPTSRSESAELLLDGLWAFHCHPSYLAIQELLVGARTDAAVADLVAPVLREAESLAIASAANLLHHEDPSTLEAWVLTSVAAMRGLAIISPRDGTAAAEHWMLVRAQLLAGLPPAT